MKPKKKQIPDNWPALIASGGVNEGAVAFMSGPRGDRLIGSSPDVHLRVTAPNVEAAHASVRWNEVGVFLDDLSKEKGTFLNGERFDQSCALGHGDRIWLGPPGDHDSVRITVQLPDHPMQFELANTPSMDDIPEAVSDQAAAEWGAMDDDENLISAVTGAKGTTGKIPKVSPPPPPAGFGPTPKPAARSFKMPEAPPLSRAVLVGIGAVVLAGGGFLYFRRAQAGGPSLVSINPPKAEIGQTVQILGSGFETNPEANSVSFDDKTAQATAATNTELSVAVPAGLSSDPKAQHKVRVESRGKQSNAIYFQIYAGPRVNSLEPDVAMPGDAVTAVGENFAAADMKVSVAGTAAEVIDSQPAAIKFRVPNLTTPPGKSVPVNVQSGAFSARPATLIIGKLPLVLEVSPSRGQAGERATIKGRGFDPAHGGSQVTFGSRPALVLGASATELQVLVPGSGALGASGELGVSVRSGGSLSTSAIVFSLARPSTAAFLPRFFAEPGGGPDAVVISSELGPFLRLSGKADASSAAERGARVATALNGLLEKASRGPASVEYREKPEPAVVAGSDAPVVVATLSDGAAYEGRPSPRALARFWAALLQDYVALFAQRTRPFRVLEMSPRGQALLDLFVAAERRGAGAGIPASLLESLPPNQFRALAEMAMSVPGGDAQASSGAAVAGRWDGTFEETGNAPRAIQVRVQTRGAQLSGTLTMRSGGISGELPLEDASYRDGAVNFTINFGARALRFSGKIDGRAVAGVVESKDGKPAGRFSLRWVD